MRESVDSPGLVQTGKRTQASTGPLILLAAPLTSEPTEALERATAICQALAGSLVFLRVTSRAPGTGGLAFVSPEPAMRRRSAYEYVLSQRSRGSRVITRAGDFLPVVAETARTLEPSFVVIPDLSGQTGRYVHGLVLESGVPVLLARTRLAPSGAIIAASDLTDPAFPVFRAAARLSASPEARVVLLHNLDSGAGALHPGPRPPRRASDRLDDFAFAAHALQIATENVVTVRPTAGEALLSIVARERPDVVIVGTRDRAGTYGGEVPLAERLIDRVSCSVVVVPLGASPDVEPAARYGTCYGGVR